jgi:hypothetical protein
MAKRTIILMGDPIYNEDDKAAEAITPGHLVTFNGSGNLIKHATAGGQAQLAIACERDEMGKSIDDAYVVNDRVKVAVLRKGDRANALVAAGAAAIAKGSFLESAGNGTFRVLASGVALARSLDTLDNSGSGAAARLRIEAL